MKRKKRRKWMKMKSKNEKVEKKYTKKNERNVLRWERERKQRYDTKSVILCNTCQNIYIVNGNTLYASLWYH